MFGINEIKQKLDVNTIQNARSKCNTKMLDAIATLRTLISRLRCVRIHFTIVQVGFVSGTKRF